MSYFADPAEVYRYLGGVFKVANDHPSAGAKLRGADLVMRIEYSAPAATITVLFREPEIQVIEGDCDVTPDVRMSMPADIGNRFWRGEYNAAVGLAKGEVKAKGPVAKVLKLLPLTKPLFPLYKELVADKDAR